MKTDTPRTDEVAWPETGLVEGDFARQLERELNAVKEQRDRLAKALRLFLNRVQYNSIFMDGKLRGGTFDYRSSGFDDEVTQAYEALKSLTPQDHE